jgi:sRNA-binding protein
VSGRDVGAALNFYVHSDSYLETLAREGAHRIGLDGSDAGTVSEDHRAHALELLEARQAARRMPRETEAPTP